MYAVSRRFVVFLACLLILICSGCATVAIAPPTSQEMAPTLEPAADKALIYVYRGKSLFGAAVQYQVGLNGRIAGGTAPGTFFVWEVEPGAHHVTSMTSESVATLAIDAEPGHTYFVAQRGKIGLLAPRVALHAVDEIDGRASVERYRQLVSAF